MHLSSVKIENFRIFGEGADALDLPFCRGLTVLVGENDSGKTAIIDALRYALGTTDQEWHTLDETDFHGNSREIRIVCRFEGLSDVDTRAFLEFLTYREPVPEPVLYINWTAKETGEVRRGRPYRQVEVRSGKDGQGPAVPPEVRDLLRATYLRPLRDAEQALSAGRGSRLSQVLHHANQIKGTGEPFDPEKGVEGTKPSALNVLGIGDFTNALLEKQQGVTGAREEIDKHLASLCLANEGISSSIGVSGAAASDDIRLRRLLEKLDLGLGGIGKLGLGSNNLLFIACELLLLAQEDAGNKLLLIEEPEAHLHAQRQLRLMRYTQEQAEARHIQVVVTTHSPNLASAVPLSNMVIVHSKRAFPLAETQTELDPSDYRFLERFLDVTKANLFFARGVLIVEGDAENILLPTLADLIGRNLTEHGVSIVNVGGVGLGRYARIFQRKGVSDAGTGEQLSIPVACVTDMDVMPDCAGSITGLSLPTIETLGEDGVRRRREERRKRASGQYVRTFVADHWTFEYDLAFCGLAQDVFVAAHLATKDGVLASSNLESETSAAIAAFEGLSRDAREAVREGRTNGSSYEETLASKVYAQFTKASKAISAQYLADRLKARVRNGELTADTLRARLPKYLVEAIGYVTAPDAGSPQPSSVLGENCD